MPSSWSIDNKTAIYIMTIIITLGGLLSYQGLPKEQFPEVVFPQILVNTIYPGTSPKDMENLVTKQIEKQVKGINGVKKVTSSSIQNFSMVNVEFGTDVDVAEAKQKVKDAVDKAKSELPTDLPKDPDVMSIDISQVPIMNINISGDYELSRLKKYADDLKDKVEGMKEITRVDIVGALDREIQINVDMYKSALANVTMSDIEMAVKYENMTIPGGQVDMGNMKRALSISGEFKSVAEIGNIVIRGGTGAIVYLKDIAEVKDAFAEQESFARLDGKNVITLNVIKRSGENLINAADRIAATIEEMKEVANLFGIPKDSKQYQDMLNGRQAEIDEFHENLGLVYSDTFDNGLKWKTAKLEKVTKFVDSLILDPKNPNSKKIPAVIVKIYFTNNLNRFVIVLDDVFPIGNLWKTGNRIYMKKLK